jgi:hypothetical protein
MAASVILATPPRTVPGPLLQTLLGLLYYSRYKANDKKSTIKTIVIERWKVYNKGYCRFGDSGAFRTKSLHHSLTSIKKDLEFHSLRHSSLMNINILSIFFISRYFLLLAAILESDTCVVTSDLIGQASKIESACPMRLQVTKHVSVSKMVATIKKIPWNKENTWIS